MENLFQIHHAMNIVDIDTVPPKKKNADGSDNPSMFPLVMNHKTAHDCWSLLETHLSRCKTSHSQSIRDELRVLKKSDTESMADYMIKIRALADNLHRCR